MQIELSSFVEYSAFYDVQILKEPVQRLDSADALFSGKLAFAEEMADFGRVGCHITSLEHKLILERSALGKFDLVEFSVGRFSFASYGCCLLALLLHSAKASTNWLRLFKSAGVLAAPPSESPEQPVTQ